MERTWLEFIVIDDEAPWEKVKSFDSHPRETQIIE
jgi:hypothetical protein